jgi:hypothetical protein
MMGDIFVFNSNATMLDIKDAIDERVTKAKAIASRLLTQIDRNETIDKEVLYSITWAINDFLEEAAFLCQKMSDKSDV